MQSTQVQIQANNILETARNIDEDIDFREVANEILNTNISTECDSSIVEKFDYLCKTILATYKNNNIEVLVSLLAEVFESDNCSISHKSKIFQASFNAGEITSKRW